MKSYTQNDRIPFTDDIMFSLVMHDEDICREFLQRILPDEEFGDIRLESSIEGDIASADLVSVETQKSIKFTGGAHGVRLDAFIKSCNMWAEIEMQTHAGDHIAKRSRFYQANMDLEYLREGREYSERPRSYVIFICTYDYIGADRPVYFFEKFDRQNCLQFGDEAYSIILNTACSPHKVPESLKPLFEYINDPSKGVGDALVNHIDERVKKFNTHEWRRKHMTLQELMDRNYKEGLEQGLEQGRSDMKFSLARTMKSKGEPVEKIAEYTGLSPAEVEALYNS